MRLQVKGKNLEVSDSIRKYAEEKLGKLNRQLHELTQVELELCVERNPSIAQNQVAEATVWTKGPTLRAREASTDMKASIDQLTEKLLQLLCSIGRLQILDDLRLYAFFAQQRQSSARGVAARVVIDADRHGLPPSNDCVQPVDSANPERKGLRATRRARKPAPPRP